MASVSENLTLISYNCEYANDIRVPFMKQLFSQCDFLCLQEHGLFKSKLPWLRILGDDVCFHGVSAMDEGQLLRGRPHGGAAIVWHGGMQHQVTPVPWNSTRLCAVTVNVGAETLLIINVYMPCDDGLNNRNVLEYSDILNDIDTICSITNATMLCVGGDFNTDLRRATPQTRALSDFCNENDLFCCAYDEQTNFDFTYCSKIDGRRSWIDHCVISNNLRGELGGYVSIDYMC